MVLQIGPVQYWSESHKILPKHDNRSGKNDPATMRDMKTNIYDINRLVLNNREQNSPL